MKAWWLQVLIALDQLLNALLGGWADETLSARAHRQSDWRRGVINAIFCWQDDHCAQSYWSERNRQQLPAEYRDA